MDFKLYDNSYLAEVVDLLRQCFPEREISPKSFIWKHFSEYFKSQSIAMLALDNQKVCSFVCFTPIQIRNISNQLIRFYSCAVQATHSDYRRQGLVSRLTQEIEKNLGTNCKYLGFSNESGVQIDRYSKKINYQILGQMASSYIFSLPYISTCKISKVEALETLPKQKSEFISLNKDQGYLDWKYTFNPKYKYEYFKFERDGNLLGYIICKNSFLKYEITDLLLKNDTSTDYKIIIKSFSTHALRHFKMLTSYTYLPNKFWAKALPLIKFSKNISIFFTLKTDVPEYLNSENWLIQGGDIH